MNNAVVTIQPFVPDCWTQMTGNRPKREGLYYINYVQSKGARLAYWQDRGTWGPGFYAVTELHVPESAARQVFRVEPAVYVTPDQYQMARGEHSIETTDKL